LLLQVVAFLKGTSILLELDELVKPAGVNVVLDEILRRAKRGAILMKQGGGERVKRIKWVSLVVDVAVYSHFADFIASMLVFFKARSLTSIWMRLLM